MESASHVDFHYRPAGEVCGVVELERIFSLVVECSALLCSPRYISPCYYIHFITFQRRTFLHRLLGVDDVKISPPLNAYILHELIVLSYMQPSLSKEGISPIPVGRKFHRLGTTALNAAFLVVASCAAEPIGVQLLPTLKLSISYGVDTVA